MAEAGPSSAEKISIKDGNEIISNDKETFKPDFTARFSDHLQNQIGEILIDCPVREEMRSCTYMVTDALEYIQEKMGVDDYIMIYAGSSTEGMFNKSDVDVMYCFNHFIVVENSGQIPPGHIYGVLLLDTVNCHSGYTRLQLHTPHPNEVMMDLFTEVDGKFYLLKDKYIEFTKTTYEQNIAAEQHGPATMVSGYSECGRPDIDYVTCLKCVVWPSVARNDIPEHIKSQVDSSTFSFCHVVGMSHCTSQRPDLEFRLSFSVAEKRLIEKWTEKQMKCYAVCKNICKEYIFVGKRISSYCVKTLILWMVEFMGTSEWEDLSIYALFKMFMYFGLQNAMEIKNIENYFVPTNNILDSLDDRQIYEYLVNLKLNFTCLPMEENNLRKQKPLEERLKDLVNVRLVTVQHCRRELSQFQTVSSYLYSENLKLDNDLYEKMIRNFPHKDDELNKKYFKFISTRCLAIFTMYDAFYTDDNTERSKLLKTAEVLFNESIEIPDELITDSGMTGFVYLALFYYFLGEKEKSKHYILKAVTAYIKCRTIWPYAEFHIVLPAGKRESIPSWLQNEEIKYLFLLCSRSEPVCLDAIMLMIYLYFKIDNDPTLFDEVLPETFPEDINPRCRYHSFALSELKKYNSCESLISKNPQLVSLVKHDLMVAATAMMKQVKQEERTYDKLMQLIFEENRKDILGQIYSSRYIRHKIAAFDETEKAMLGLLEENRVPPEGLFKCCMIV